MLPLLLPLQKYAKEMGESSKGGVEGKTTCAKFRPENKNFTKLTSQRTKQQKQIYGKNIANISAQFCPLIG